MQQQAAAQRHRQGDGVVGDLCRAVVGDVADEDVAVGGGGPVDAVVADAHADDGAQAGECGRCRRRVTYWRKIIRPSAAAQSSSERSERRVVSRMRMVAPGPKMRVSWVSSGYMRSG